MCWYAGPDESCQKRGWGEFRFLNFLNINLMKIGRHSRIFTKPGKKS